MLAHYSCGAVVLCLLPVATPAGDGRFLTCSLWVKMVEIVTGMEEGPLPAELGAGGYGEGLSRQLGQLHETCTACTAVGCSLCLAVMISMMCCWHSNPSLLEAFLTGGTQCASCKEVTVMQEIKSSLGVGIHVF